MNNVTVTKSFYVAITNKTTNETDFEPTYTDGIWLFAKLPSLTPSEAYACVIDSVKTYEVDFAEKTKVNVAGEPTELYRLRLDGHDVALVKKKKEKTNF